MADTIWTLDLDAKEFTEKLEGIRGSLEKIGDAKNLSGLVHELTGMAGTLAIVGAAFFAVKTIFDSTFDAAQMEIVNAQFEQLTENANISGEALKEGLEKAANGMYTTNELTKAANKSLIEMGSSAEKLPELFEIARNQARIFGIDTLDAFERINHAIATGQMRGLKQLGLQIQDVNKVYRDFAVTMGTTAEALTDQGKRHALLNAVLEEGKRKHVDLNESLTAADVSVKQWKTAMSEAGEAVTMFIAKLTGGYVRSFLDTMSKWAKEFSGTIRGVFGSDMEKIDHSIQSTTKSLAEQNEQLVFLKGLQGEGGLSGMFHKIMHGAAEIPETEKNIERLTETLKKLKDEKDKIEVDREPSGESEKKSGNDSGDVDHEKALESENKFQSEILKIQMAATKQKMQLSMDEAEVERLREKMLLQIHEETALKMAEVDAKEKKDGRDRSQERVALMEEENNKIRQMHYEKEADMQRVSDNRLKNEKTGLEGFQNGFHQTMMKAKADAQDMSMVASQAMNAFAGTAAQGLMAVGAGSKDAGDQMKKFLLNAIADICQAKGTMYLLDAIESPAYAAAGAGLLVLAGFLRAQAGSAGGGSSGSSSYGGAASSGGSLGGSSSSSSSPGVTPSSASAAANKSVSVTIQGHYFDSQETRTRLVDLIRQESDATDFKIG